MGGAHGRRAGDHTVLRGGPRHRLAPGAWRSASRVAGRAALVFGLEPPVASAGTAPELAKQGHTPWGAAAQRELLSLSGRGPRPFGLLGGPPPGPPPAHFAEALPPSSASEAGPEFFRRRMDGWGLLETSGWTAGRRTSAPQDARRLDGGGAGGGQREAGTGDPCPRAGTSPGDRVLKWAVNLRGGAARALFAATMRRV